MRGIDHKGRRSWCLDGLGARLQFLNSRVCGLNPDTGSNYSIDGVTPGLGFLKKQRPWPFTVHCTISSVHQMVIEKNFYMLCVIAWCAVVSRETLVKHCNLYLHLQPDEFSKYLSLTENFWESYSDNSTSHLNDDTLLCGLTIDSIVQNFVFFSRGTNLKI